MIMEKKNTSEKVIGFLLGNRALLLLILLTIALAIMSPYFFTTRNLLNLVKQACVLSIMGMGFTLLLSSGSMDLSVGNLMAMVGVCMAYFDTKLGWPAWATITMGTGIGIVGLCFNTFLVFTFNLPGFILTLATGMIYKGILWLISGGTAIGGISEWFKFMGQGDILGIPFQLYAIVFLLIVLSVILRKTKFGRHALAMGGSMEAARVSGVNIQACKYIVAIIMGFCVSLTAMIATGRAASAQVNAGADTAMDTIAAVVIGGTPMSGGIANVPGTVVGCLLIQMIANGLNLMDVNSNWHQVAKGLIIIVAIIMDVQSTKIMDRIRAKNAK